MHTMFTRRSLPFPPPPQLGYEPNIYWYPTMNILCSKEQFTVAILHTIYSKSLSHL